MEDYEILERIRLILGNISQESLPESIIEAFLVINKQSYITNGELLYHTVISSVNYLITQEVQEGGPSRVMTMEGQVMLDIQGLDTINAWQKWLSSFKRDPSGYLEPPLLADLNKVSRSVIIGGVRKDDAARVENNSNRLYKGYTVGRFFDME